MKKIIVLCLLFSNIAAFSKEDEEWSFEDTVLYEDEMDDCYDPLEPYNRLMFQVNDAIDKVLLKPLALAYRHILPLPIQTGIENFARNFFAPLRVINFTLQKDSENLVNSFFGFLINTTMGFFGVFDVASKIGFPQKQTNLGDTFKKWGARPGPYIVLPILGPTSMRGAFGKTMQLPFEPAAQVSLLHYKKNTRNRLHYTIYAADIIAKRASVLSLMKDIEKTSTDMYITTRNVVMSLES